jgi:hypothetical protein
MHRHRHFRHGHRPWRPFGGLFWLLLFAFFILGGRWWPGILILIGLSILFGSLFRDSSTEPPQEQTAPPVTVTAPVPAVTVSAVPVEPFHRADLLPADCPHCGGPVRVQEVRWTGKQSAACAYCGSNLPMKKG